MRKQFVPPITIAPLVLGLLGFVGLIAFAALRWWNAPGAEPGATTAEAMMNYRPDEAWPPAQEDLDTQLMLTATRARALDGGRGHDAGASSNTRPRDRDSGPVDAAVLDAGPPIVLPDDDALHGLLVRRGQYEEFHYLEVVLGAESFDDALPIVFVFHGRGARAQLPGGPFRSISHPVRVIVPQAPERLGEGWAWLPVTVGSGLVDRLSASLFHLGNRLAQFIRVVSAERNTVGRPILSGFSQGGLIVYTLALLHDDVVSHAFPLSAWLPPPLEPVYRRQDLRYPPIRAMHGSADPVVPSGPTRDLAGRLGALGFDIEFTEFPGVHHEMTAEMNAVFHRWLERAVCDEVGDVLCPAAADPADDAGVIVDAGTDAAIDAAAEDAGRVRRRRSRSDRDASR